MHQIAHQKRRKCIRVKNLKLQETSRPTAQRARSPRALGATFFWIASRSVLIIQRRWPWASSGNYSIVAQSRSIFVQCKLSCLLTQFLTGPPYRPFCFQTGLNFVSIQIYFSLEHVELHFFFFPNLQEDITFAHICMEINGATERAESKSLD